MSILHLFKNDIKIGELYIDAKRAFVFCYDRNYLNSPDSHPISLSLPLQIAPFENDISRPFFSNLLPEGNVRDSIAKISQISKNNDFALLKKIGGECAGAVSLFQKGIRAKNVGKYIELSDKKLDSMISEKIKRPLMISHNNLRLSLAGAQEKLPVLFKNNRFFLPTGNLPSSHIIKPQNPYFFDSVQNEAFCMMLAKSVGINVESVFVWKTKKNIIYVINRYDREADETGNIKRIHQEDFCQALGFMPDQKYQSEGGPGLVDCFNLIQKNSIRPVVDRKQLMEWVIFNYLIGNADAHGKNLSILFKNGQIVLAPFYDLMSTLVYPELSNKMSMKIGRENRFKWIQKRHWEGFAIENNINTKYMFKAASQLSEKLNHSTDLIAKKIIPKYGGKVIIQKICSIIRDRSELFV